MDGRTDKVIWRDRFETKTNMAGPLKLFLLTLYLCSDFEKPTVGATLSKVWRKKYIYCGLDLILGPQLSRSRKNSFLHHLTIWHLTQKKFFNSQGLRFPSLPTWCASDIIRCMYDVPVVHICKLVNMFAPLFLDEHWKYF